MWKGDNASHWAIRSWARRLLKDKKGTCETCRLKPAFDLASKSGEHKRDLTDWFYLCRTCHMNYDGRMDNIRKWGKKLQEKNLKKRPTIVQLKKRLWELCKQIVRARDMGICQACGAKGLVGVNAQTSHLIPSSICGGLLRYDVERNLYLCCYNCNINLGGNLAELYRNVLIKSGQMFVDNLYMDKNKSIQLDRIFLENKIELYKKLLK